MEYRLNSNKFEESKKNKEIIGRHGDGLKAVALTCLKNGMCYWIKTSGEEWTKEWTFTLEDIPNFTREGQNTLERGMYVTR